MEKMHGNYKRLFYVGTDGVAYFSMRVSKSALPYDSEYNTFTCSGKVPEYNQGYPLTLYGEWNVSADGKWKFVVESFEEDLKSGRVLEEFLFHNIEGVGEKIAKKIVKLGDSLWDIIKLDYAEDELIRHVHLSEKTCKSVISLLRKKESRYEVYCFLSKYGITDIKVDKLISQYGYSTLNLIKQNPYQTLEYHNIPFAIMDEIAFCEGLPFYFTSRILSILHFAMKQCTYNGSSYVSLQKLVEKAQKIAEESLYGMRIPRGFLALAFQRDKKLYVDKENDRVYYRDMWDFEQSIIHNIFRLQNTSHKLGYLESEIQEVEDELGITYAPAQKEAFHILDDSGVKILTGGPGTGKTTLLNGLLKVYQKHHPKDKIVLCAPTGMASERMSQSTGKEASTVHKLLDYRPFGEEDAVYKNLDNPIDADLIIIDETSMLDTKLTGMLLNAITSGSLVLFCGDVDQLDSVGQGAVLRDMIQSEVLSVYRLQTLFRQSKESNIVQNALKINHAETKLNLGPDFRVVRYHKNVEIHELLDKIFTSYRRSFFDTTQILSTTRKSDGGTYSINNYIQRKIPFEEGRTIHRNGYVFHTGDKIMTLKNNYHAGYFNGDVGKIIEITEMGRMTIQIKEKVILMQTAWLEEIVPAYAVTVHKSQGSEFENVIIIMPKNPTLLLERSLIYTAVTRAKNNVIILSQDDALEQAIKTNTKNLKQTSLKEKLIHYYNK